MKTKLRLLLLVAFSYIGLSAQTFTDNGIKYNITDADAHTVEVTSNSYTGAIDIPPIASNSGETYSVTAIGDNAFQYCSNVTSVTIPNGILRIGNSAFAECYKLTAVAIPASVTNIAEGAFSNCMAVTQYTVDTANPAFTSDGGALFDKNKTLLLAYPMANTANAYSVPATVTALGKYVFYNNSKLTSLTLPTGLTRINDYAVYFASNLETMNIPASLGYIGESALDNSLWYKTYYDAQPDGMIFINQCLYAYKGSVPDNSDLTIPDGTTQICASVFKNASGLKSVTFPASLTNIGIKAFMDCSNLTAADIPNSVTQIGESAFYGCSNLQSVTLPNGLATLEENTFSDCSALNGIAIPASVTSIGNSAFSASGLTSITIPATVTSMGKWIFDGCSNLTSAVFQGTLASIGESAFMMCGSLVSVTLPEGLISLEMGAFAECQALTTITIPSSVTNLDNFTFMNCTGLSQLQCNAETPPALGVMVFGNVNTATCILIVPENSVTAYKTADVWKDFNKITTSTPIKKSDNLNIILTPNPATDYFTVEGLDKVTTIFVFDVSGKLILQKQVSPNEKVSVSNWNKGTYFVKVNEKAGKLVVAH